MLPRDQQEAAVRTALLAAFGTEPQYLEPMRRRIAEWQQRLQDDGIDPSVAMIVRLAIDGLCLGEYFGIAVPQGGLRQRVIDKLINMTRTDSATKG
jgi:hypothetical protein